MGRISVLSMKKQMDGKGEYFTIVMNLDGQLTRCFLRSNLARNELLQKLYSVNEMQDLYLIDDKAIMYTA